MLLRNTFEIPAEGIIKGQGLGIGDKINEVKSTCYSNISFVMRGENSKIILKFLQQQLPGTDIENFTLFNKMWSWYDWTSLLLPRYPTLVLRLVKLLECWIFNFLHLYLTFKHPSIHHHSSDFKISIINTNWAYGYNKRSYQDIEAVVIM